MKRALFILFAISVAAFGLSQQLSFVGNTSQYLTGVGQLPSRGAYVQPYETVSITTQTYPISPGQSTFLIYTTDNWAHSTRVQLSFDFNTAQNTQWYTVLGPLPSGDDLQYYIEADSTSGTTLYDNNGSQNFGFTVRYQRPARRGAILQWFATPYSTIIRRLPEVVRAGYGAIYLPPPQKSGGGGFSVGYNPFDRFDLGDRLQLGTVDTAYGSTEELENLIQLAHRFGLEVYCDLVLNHNDNRAVTPIDTYPNLIPEDFHIHSSTDTTNSQIDFNNAPNLGFNILNYDLSGLADIAHEDGNLVESGQFSLPNWASFNQFGKPSFVRQPLSPQDYPNGKPVAEDVRQYLDRWCWWLETQIGFDGFRLDAVRHFDPGFLDTVSYQGGFQVSVGALVPQLMLANPNLMLFGEDNTTDSYEQREFIKTGIDLLDFPLKYATDSLFNSSGYGSLGQVLSNTFSVDSATGATFQNGGLSPDVGVSFEQSHDQGPPTSSNLDSAFDLTRPGSTIVYYDGNNLDPNNYNQFPKPGRYDALGYGDQYVEALVDARMRFGRGQLVNRYVSDHLYVYERQVDGRGVELVGLNNRGDLVPLSATIQTAFSPGTVLEDISGQEPNLTVDAGGQIVMTVPPNSSASSSNNAQGYSVYVPVAPHFLSTELVDGNSGQPISPSTVSAPGGAFGATGSYTVYDCPSSTVILNFSSDFGANCFAKLDQGLPLPGLSLLQNTPEGLTDGFFQLQGTGSFTSGPLDLSGLPSGLHLIRVRVFANTGANPGVFRDETIFVHIDHSTLASVSGDLTKYGQPISTQVNTPTSQANRLDELFVANDANYLYLGLAGQTDTSESHTNGLVALLDTFDGANAGVTAMNQLSDDYGPAGRLLSNSALALPSGFSADFAIASFREATIDSSGGLGLPEDVAFPPAFGARAGLFLLNSSSPSKESGLPAKLAWMPRSSPFGTPTGLEAAIPLQSLYTGQIPSSGSIGVLAYMTTTGETGTTLQAHDPNRGALGGRPKARGYLLNQFLPPQPGITSDPGLSPTQATAFSTYQLKKAAPISSLKLWLSNPVPGQKQGTYVQTVRIIDTTSRTIGGPIYLLFRLGQGITVENGTRELLYPNTSYLVATKGNILSKQTITLQVTFDVAQGKYFQRPKEYLVAGSGIP